MLAQSCNVVFVQFQSVLFCGMEAAEMGDVGLFRRFRSRGRVAVVHEVVERRLGGQPAGEGALGAGEPDTSAAREGDAASRDGRHGGRQRLPAGVLGGVQPRLLGKGGAPEASRKGTFLTWREGDIFPLR